VSVKKVLIALE